MNPFDFIEYEEPDLQKFKRIQELRKAFEAARIGNYKPVPGNEDHSATQMQWFPKFREFEDYEKHLSNRASEVGVEPEVSFAEPNLLEAGWIDTKKELPNNDRFVIIYWNNGYHNEMNVAFYDALDMRWYDHNRESFTDNVTHWQEFPPKP